MIDLVHNETTGVSIVHDEVGLSQAKTFFIDGAGRCGLKMANGRVRRFGRRAPADMLEDIRASADCQIIRMIGFRVVESAPLNVEAN